MQAKLTELSVARIRPPKSGRLEVWDTTLPAFGLRITSAGARSYVVALRKPGAKHPARIKVGEPGEPPRGISLADARTRARELMADPGALEPHEEATPDTVASMAAEYVERHLKRNTRRWRDAEQMLARDVLPHWGDRVAADIGRRDVLDLADGIMDRSPVSANRVLSLIRRLYNWGMERGIIEANPAAGIKPPHWEHPRDRILSEDELRALWGAWETMGYPFGTIQRLLLLTAQRRGEVAAMRWDQLDLDRGVWRLASTDTKTGREHVLPLSPPVVEILERVPRFGGSPLLFPANRRGSARPVSGYSKAKRVTDRLSGIEGWTWHDLRRTAATGMAKLNVPPHVCERILNHSGSGMMSAIARVYNVHSYQAEMGQALDAWGREVERIIGRGEAKVIALHG
jgi:integrase